MLAHDSPTTADNEPTVPGSMDSRTDSVRIVATLGDPRGVGPELLPRAVEQFLTTRSDVEFVLLGHEAGLPGVSAATARAVGTFDGSLESAGIVALQALEEGVRMCVSGRADALVTGPVHKPAMRAAGVEHPGQTELLRELTASEEVGMLMHAESTPLGGPLRILLATTHLPLREVPDHLTSELILGQARLLWRSLRHGWGIRAPRVALCGLNPHASDEGLFGDEEARILLPAVQCLRKSGIEISDPLPADTVFLKAIRGGFDAVIAPYHDVGMAVFKTLGFGHGVNTTLGLPFPRTSPDHGTAFDLVGTGQADHTSSLEALKLAVELARRVRSTAL